MIVVCMLSELKKAWGCFYCCMLIASKEMEEIWKLNQKLGSEFEMKDIGLDKKILGWRLFRI